MAKKSDVLQGTLDLLVLRILALEPLHGYGVAQRLEQVSQGVFQVNPGTLFPALYRLEEEGWVTAEWRPSEHNRRAKYYRLTKAGHRQLDSRRQQWDTVSVAIRRVLDAGLETP